MHTATIKTVQAKQPYTVWIMSKQLTEKNPDMNNS